MPAPTRRIRAARACCLPPVLLSLLPYGHIPRRNRSAVLAAPDSSTVDRLAERIAGRIAGRIARRRTADGVRRTAPSPSCTAGSRVLRSASPGS
ncbi:hypothetical protein [Streptomyces sp. NPDC086519]|uniref:hypothetical protein n=1 Tax=Streptomyces sp. NPDC086519 TaxID=3154863 RepID=UPI003446F123